MVLRKYIGITTIVDATRLAYYTPLAGVSSLAADVLKTLTTDSYVNTTGIITASQFWSNGELVTGSQVNNRNPRSMIPKRSGTSKAPTSQGTQGPYGFQAPKAYKVSTPIARNPRHPRYPRRSGCSRYRDHRVQPHRALKVKTEPR